MLGVERFLCAHTIMLALEGIPGVYFQSLLGSLNDHERVAMTGSFRSINRHHWGYHALVELLGDDKSHYGRVFTAMKRLISIRTGQSAFHPNATQFTLHLGEQIFGFWRQGLNRRQSIFCLNNISDKPAVLLLSDLNLISTHQWSDLLSGNVFDDLHATVEIAPYQSIWLSNEK